MLARFSKRYSSAKTTRLYDYHLKHGGKMVEFAGYKLPIQYSDMGIIASHNWTRMVVLLRGNARWTGKDRVKFIESLVVSDIAALPMNTSTLSVFTTAKGGILDDTVITRQQSSLYVVTNAGCIEKDMAHINAKLAEFNLTNEKVKVEKIDRSLIAFQGPKAALVLERLTDIKNLMFTQSRYVEIGGIAVQIARGGYTGEDGFEISVEHDDVEALCDLLMSHPEVRNAGLGARDSLRLEAGMCLYGHDLDESITPVEAGLTWTIGQRRRLEGGFLGSEFALPQIKGGVSKKRVGFTVEGAPAREGAKIYSLEGEEIGNVTSGIPSPVLKMNIAMGYIRTGFHKTGTEFYVEVRGKKQKSKIVKLPFVANRYLRLTFEV